MAFDYFTGLGWNVKRAASEKRGYDLECSNKDRQMFHVEVNGTRTCGQKVPLTGNEVKHNRNAAECGADHALYVVSDIDVSPEGQCSGGRARLHPDLEHRRPGLDHNAVRLHGPEDCKAGHLTPALSPYRLGRDPARILGSRENDKPS
jgi:hypothetical protein